MSTLTRTTLITATLVALVVAVALAFPASDNSGIPTSALSQQQATEMVTNHLNGYNDRDYATFSRDFHPSLRDGITEEGFHGFHDVAITKIGRYLAVREVELQWGQMSGVVVWVATVDFEHESGVEVRLAFQPDGVQIEGTRFLADALAN